MSIQSNLKSVTGNDRLEVVSFDRPFRDTRDSDAFSGENGDRPVDSDMKEYVDLKLETAQAHNNAQFAIIIQRLDSMQESMNSMRDSMRESINSIRDSMPTKWTMFATAVSTVFAVSGIVIAIMAYGGDRFDSGMSTTSVSVQGVVDAKEDAREAREIATRNAEEMRSIQADLDTILSLLSEQEKQ